jgi:hypothetical protein
MTTIVNKLYSCLTVLFLLSCLLSSNAFSAITDVSRTGDPVNCELAWGFALNDGDTAYCDQSYTWTGFPPEADGILLDYIIVSDADSSVSDYGLTITVDLPGVMILLIDPAVNVGTDMPWVGNDGYVKEDGINFTLDKGGSTVVFDLWTLEVEDPSNPIVTGPQNNSAANNYVVLYDTDAADLSISIVADPDPYILDSGDLMTVTYTIENLGHSDTDNVVVSFSSSGITPGITFFNRVWSPNTTFNQLGEGKWRMATLGSGETETMVVTLILAPDQTVGTGVITANAQIDASDIMDPNLDNNMAVETTSVFDLGDRITGLSRLGASANCEPTPGGTLHEGSIAYCDQSYTWINIPPEADGVLLDYIIVSDEDRSVSDYGLSITVDLPGVMILLIDSAVDVGTDMPWVGNDGYVKEDGINFTLDKGGSTVVFDIWALEVEDTSNPIVTGPQNKSDANNYGVVYVTDTADLSISIVDDPDPYIQGSGVNWTRTFSIENLGASDTDNVVVSFSGSGVTPGRTFVSRVWSPNSTYNEFGERKWRMTTLEEGDTATMEVTLIFAPDQTVGTDVITVTAQIDSSDIFDPILDNNTATAATSVLPMPDDVTFKDGFEDP